MKSVISSWSFCRSHHPPGRFRGWTPSSVATSWKPPSLLMWYTRLCSPASRKASLVGITVCRLPSGSVIFSMNGSSSSSSQPSSACAWASIRATSSRPSGGRASSTRPRSLYSGTTSATRGSSSSSERERQQQRTTEKNKNVFFIFIACGVGFLGLSYAFVPLYRAFCKATGFGGTPLEDKKGKRLRDLNERKEDLAGRNREFTVRFTADTSIDIPWTFEPIQKSLMTQAGESVLAFYNATNKSDRSVIGVATYNVNPPRAAQYFVKVQCFCFDEQRLLPGESVDMPVLFYLDPDILEDRRLDKIDTLTLSYTFFMVEEFDDEEEEGEAMPAPQLTSSTSHSS
mmetsp:Transcript_6332/g.17940  ORF Transcript_6332/g.17940 Transcript_6332/m.17940 type:complete len:343 (-) Transcript_6332:347-1375(-)